MTTSALDANSTVSHNGPAPAKALGNSNDQASTMSSSPMQKGHRRGSSLPALRHLEQLGRDYTSGHHQSSEDDDDNDDDDDHECLDTPNDDLDDFVKGFCDSDNMHDVDSRVWVVQSRCVALD